MNITHIIRNGFYAAFLFALSAHGESPPPGGSAINPNTQAASNADQEKKAAEWVKTLNLGDPAKESRVQKVIAVHLTTIRDWHNEHPFSTGSGSMTSTGR
jgi:hypothetical protein